MTFKAAIEKLKPVRDTHCIWYESWKDQYMIITRNDDVQIIKNGETAGWNNIRDYEMIQPFWHFGSVREFNLQHST